VKAGRRPAGAFDAAEGTNFAWCEVLHTTPRGGILACDVNKWGTGYDC
jgi:hypothetical protein